MGRGHISGHAKFSIAFLGCNGGLDDILALALNEGCDLGMGQTFRDTVPAKVMWQNMCLELKNIAQTHP